jgi:hypothetical protein
MKEGKKANQTNKWRNKSSNKYIQYFTRHIHTLPVHSKPPHNKHPLALSYKVLASESKVK